jgi:tRNA(Ile2) C34 agmatinyltransferase TiaS
MSELGTKIIASGLVDEGVEVEMLQKELESLRRIIEDGKPICPICKRQMKPVNFKGYYDEFSYWECGCKKFVNGENVGGMYT